MIHHPSIKKMYLCDSTGGFGTESIPHLPDPYILLYIWNQGVDRYLFLLAVLAANGSKYIGNRKIREYIPRTQMTLVLIGKGLVLES